MNFQALLDTFYKASSLYDFQPTSVCIDKEAGDILKVRSSASNPKYKSVKIHVDKQTFDRISTHVSSPLVSKVRGKHILIFKHFMFIEEDFEGLKVDCLETVRGKRNEMLNIFPGN